MTGEQFRDLKKKDRIRSNESGMVFQVESGWQNGRLSLQLVKTSDGEEVLRWGWFLNMRPFSERQWEHWDLIEVAGMGPDQPKMSLMTPIQAVIVLEEWTSGKATIPETLLKRACTVVTKITRKALSI